EKGRPLSKFGEWDVNDPASAEGFTVIFNKARDEKKTGGKPESPGKVDPNIRHGGVDTGTGTGRPSSHSSTTSSFVDNVVLLSAPMEEHGVLGDNPVEQNYYLHYDNHAFDEYCKLEYPSVPKRKRFLRVAFVNWAVHWLAWRCLNDGRYQNFILAIDVDGELFCEIRVLKSFRQDEPLDYHLSVSGDGNSVAMFTTTRGRNCPEDFLDIWVMKEYGIEDSWAKLITLSPPDPERRVPYKPLCFRNNGEVVS
ncbi:hypothetical protein DVH24_041917, partial [Malus domestica]